MALNRRFNFDGQGYNTRAYKGPFETIEKLRYYFPLAESGDFAFLEDSESFVYWNKTAKDWKYVDYVSDLNGSNYIMVYGTGTPEENGAEFIAAYNLAKTMPRYLHAANVDRTVDDTITIYKGQTFDDENMTNSYAIATNTIINGPSNTVTADLISETVAKSVRTTIVVAPGHYKFASEFVHDASGIDIVSLTGNRDVLISATSIQYSFGINAHYSMVKGINTSFIGNKSIRVYPNLSNLEVINCVGGNNSFCDNSAQGKSVTGNFIDCEGGDGSFINGSGTTSVLSGKFIRCIGGDYSFASSGKIINAYFEDCKGGNYSFGSNDGEYASEIHNTTVFKNCWAVDNSFGFNSSSSSSFNYGKYYYCINTGANSGLLNGDIFLYCSVNGVIP